MLHEPQAACYVIARSYYCQQSLQGEWEKPPRWKINRQNREMLFFPSSQEEFSVKSSVVWGIKHEWYVGHIVMIFLTPCYYATLRTAENIRVSFLALLLCKK